MFRMSSVTDLDERSTRRLALAILFVILVINLLFFYGSLHDGSSMLGPMLYGLNTAMIVLMGVTLLMPSFFLIDKESFAGTLASLLTCVIAVVFTCAALISFVVTFGDDFIVAGPIGLISAVLALGVYTAYQVKQFLEKN